MTEETTPTDTTTSPPDAAVDAGTVLGGDLPVDAVTDPAATDAPAATDTPEAAVGAPEKYEFALEGVDLDPEMLTAAEPVLRDLNLTNEAANKLLPMANDIVTRTAERTLAQLTEAAAVQRNDWLTAAKADPDIGGAKFEETTHLAAKGLDALGFKAGHPFRTALTESGFGNHPDMIRAFRALGGLVGEDGSFVRSDAGAKDQAPIWDRMYVKS